MNCAISGEPAKDPVVSKKSGGIFSKDLIEKYIEDNGVDPLNNEPISKDDLIPILNQSPIVTPRPPTLTSIPSLLSAFQQEWDAAALGTFSLRKQLLEAKQNISTLSYQLDAAIRVIARLTHERDESRTALLELAQNVGAISSLSQNTKNQINVASINSDKMDIDQDQINSQNQSENEKHEKEQEQEQDQDQNQQDEKQDEEIKNQLENKNENKNQINDTNENLKSIPDNYITIVNNTINKLSSMRRNRKIPDDYPTADYISSNYSIVNLRGEQTVPVNSRNFVIQSTVLPSSKKYQIAICGCAKIRNSAITWLGNDSVEEAVSIKSFGDHISSGIAVCGLILSVEEKGEEEEEKIAAVYLTSKNILIGVSSLTGDVLFKFTLSGLPKASKALSLYVHPSQLTIGILCETQFVLVGLENISKPERIGSIVFHNELGPAICAAFHPDGHLLATGFGNGLIVIYDVRKLCELSRLPIPFSPGDSLSISFSENGYWLAAANSSECNISLYDLRKATLAKNIPISIGGIIKHISFDYSGHFLAVVNSEGKEHQEWNGTKLCILDIRGKGGKSTKEVTSFDIDSNNTDNKVIGVGWSYGSAQAVFIGYTDSSISVLCVNKK